jgi:hypothetical protein
MLAQTATKASQRNATLELLQFPFGFEEYRSELDYLLDLNRGGRRLLQEAQHGRVCPSLWPVVLERVNALFECLRS